AGAAPPGPGPLAPIGISGPVLLRIVEPQVGVRALQVRDERPQFVDEPRPGGGAGALEVLEAAESSVGAGGVECVHDRGALVVGGARSWLRHEREGIWPTGDGARRAVGDDLARRRNLGTVLEHVLS